MSASLNGFVGQADRVVLLDMDGVLVDFVDRAYEACGVDPHTRTMMAQRIKSWDDVHVPLGITQTELWRRIDDWGEHFWSHAPWRTGATAALIVAEGIGQVYLCSSPSRLSESRSGKHKWVERQLPEYAHRLILCKDKHLLAQPGRVLIDDNPHNCQRFIECGGDALLVPHACNSASDLPRLRSFSSIDVV